MDLSDGVDAVPLKGRQVSLEPILPQHYEAIYRAELAPDLGGRWRQQGATPSLESFVQGFWAGVLAQFLIVDRSAKAAVGYVSAYNSNFKDGHAFAAIARFDAAKRSPLILLGGALFINYLFETWSFRKLYADTAEYNLAQFGSGMQQYFVEEGRLRDHEWYRGRFWDRVTIALYREEWQKWRTIVMSYVLNDERFQQDPSGPIRPTRDWAQTPT